MAAHQRTESVVSFLMRVIIVLARREGGELRIKAADLDLIRAGERIFKDWDPSSQEIVIRSSTDSAQIFTLEGESDRPPWIENQKPQEQNQQTPPRRAVTTDEIAIAVEQRMRERWEERKRRQTQAEAARAMREMFSGESVNNSSS